MKWEIDVTHSPREIRKYYGKTLEELILQGEPIIICDADLASSSGAGGLFKKYPNNCVDFGICESNMISASAGMSRTGLKPFVHSFSPFVSRRVLDQIYVSAAFANQSIHIYASDPGFWSLYNGATHTTFEDIAQLKSIPNLNVVAPSDAISFSWILKYYAKNGGIYYNRAPRKVVNSIYKVGSEFEYGKSQIIRKGKDIALIAIGSCVYDSLLASEKLKEHDISPTVVDLFFIKPLDKNLIKNILNTHKYIVTVENHSIYGGIGEMIGALIAEENNNNILRRIGIKDKFGEVGTKEYLKDKFQISTDYIIDTVINLVK